MSVTSYNPQMPSYQYMLYLFQVNVFDANGQIRKKPAWLWMQVGAGPTFAATVVFDNREQMFAAVRKTTLVSPKQLADADKAFRERAIFDCLVDVPIGKENLVTPNLTPEPGEVSPSPEYAKKLDELRKSREK